MQHHIQVKRAYDPAAPGDGARILVDRLWPRGLSKAKAKLTTWVKDAAPTSELREWFHAAPDQRWPEFQRRYRAELEHNPEALAELAPLLAQGPVTLLFAAKDKDHNNAVVLAAYLRRQSGDAKK